jgi:hypothetical protein
MIRLRGIRLPLILVRFFITLAVMVSFCLGAGEVPGAARLALGRMGGITGWGEDNFIPSPIEDPVLLIKTGDTQLSPETGFQRIFTPCGMQSVTAAFYQPPFGASSNVSRVNVNTILLKLRI